MKNTMKKISDFLRWFNTIVTLFFGFFWPMGFYHFGVVLAALSLVAILTWMYLKITEHYTKDKVVEELEECTLFENTQKVDSNQESLLVAKKSGIPEEEVKKKAEEEAKAKAEAEEKLLELKSTRVENLKLAEIEMHRANIDKAIDYLDKAKELESEIEELKIKVGVVAQI